MALAQTIMLSGLDWYNHRERIGAGVITPGMLLETDSNGAVAPHSGGIQGGVFARRDIVEAGDINRDYADGDLIRIGFAQPGDQINGIINAGTTAIVVGDNLISDGAGGLVKAAAEVGKQIVGVALTAAADPGAGIGRVTVEVM